MTYRQSKIDLFAEVEAGVVFKQLYLFPPEFIFTSYEFLARHSWFNLK
jgi:hypothetical protein